MTIAIALMIAFILLMVINAFVIYGFHLATAEGMILHIIEQATDDMPLWIQKPLHACPTCMASVHSVYVYWTSIVIMDLYVMDVNYLLALIAYPIYILGLSAMATIVYNYAE
jgi:hypothetical protein